MAEYLPGFEISAWAGIGAPKNTPSTIVDTLNREINLGLADPAIKQRLANLGGAPFISTPAELAKFVTEQTEERARIVQAANIKPE
jgi:tripartite-type tricarboxylate transporter receptor subunit TctC